MRPRVRRSWLALPREPEREFRFDPCRLVQARRLCGWSRTELAEQVGYGVTAARVCWFESGVTVPRPDELARIAEATGQLVAFFAAGRPMLRIDSSEVFVCEGSDWWGVEASGAGPDREE